MARPSEYNFDMAIEICQKVASGLNVIDVLDSDSRYPEFPTWCTWKRNNRELLKAYLQSMQDKAEREDKEIALMIEKLESREIDPASANVIINARKWRAAKYYPKFFGDSAKLLLVGDDDDTGSVSIEIIRKTPE